MTWFEEIDPSNSVGMKFKVTEKLFEKQSPFQKVEVFQTEGHGRLLAHDGMVMTTDKDEFIYHDMITHVPLFTHPNPQSVLIIGGGDGGTAREVLRHANVKSCTMVEIDPVVIEAAKEFLPQTSCEFENAKLNLKIADGVEFIQTTQEKFDVILVDSSDPVGPAAPLFNEEVYKNIHRILTDDGIVVSQCESPYYHHEMQGVLLKILQSQFQRVHIYNYNNLSYPGGQWSFSFASKGLCPLRDFQEQRFNDSAMDFQYYNEEIHRGAFALPNFMKKRLSPFLTPFERQ